MKQFGMFAIALFAFYSGNSIAWEVTKDFNQGVIGEKGTGSSSLSSTFSGSTISDFPGPDGTNSLKLTIQEGSDGWAEFGGIESFPTNLIDGDEFWFELYFYIPNDFEIRTPGNGSLKFIRFRSTGAAGEHEYYLDLQLVDDTSTEENDFRMIREGSGGWNYFGNRPLVQRDKWHKLNMLMRVGTETVVQGGRSEVFVWLDNSLIVRDTDIDTLLSPGGLFNSLYLFTYWNGYAPKTQSLWVDNLSIANEVPSWADPLMNLDRRPSFGGVSVVIQ